MKRTFSGFHVNSSLRGLLTMLVAVADERRAQRGGLLSPLVGVAPQSAPTPGMAPAAKAARDIAVGPAPHRTGAIALSGGSRAAHAPGLVL
ncbi:hypothetical protein [Sorangium sp. So ce861]|uniref:hypothetical protein n=1 Tax=Sorangium sp. So ce861 TaxID=3133323 RepID=UPI003F61E440